MANRIVRSKKPVLKTIHTWIGIVSGVFLSVIALTGSVIVFRAEFEQAALPRSVGNTSRRASLDEAFREIRKLRPDVHIRRVRFAAGPSDPLLFQVQSSAKHTERFALDATSGQVLGSVQSGWVEWMIDLHRNLLSGATGRQAVGAAGVVLLVLSTTGLLMWFDRRAQLASVDIGSP